ncbi:pyridoxamine 5'-phosphate oxidase-related, FMN-binding protein [Methanothrix thermoacetophila PT]|jgi:predicted pyridoxine 5'-phosphate oxidase superfamily flavin-nucleotide-binding protein|uniref:Pyridoxamine 5'-phosphate oxidase-related, FMN-binding protein n=1 Tax=Methanothrix thermoacetophila (strain DSM 6194 / JCM 14653 / NBRC 101360 / PT) TaxID=349307 RepID=A0B799_METTP|nr:pyridoxamine 5'-phosphate oxidase-related, FMN-binding protein [Methanothrix thermoacetophila PT]
MKLSEEIKQMLDENIVYLATSTRDGKPNVVPIGSAYAISDNEILIHDMMFVKTRANLEANPQVAISFTDTRRWESYQLKGTAKIFTEGEMFEKVLEIMKIKAERQKDHMESISDQRTKERMQRMMELHKNLKPKAAVLIIVEEIYSNMPEI